MKTAGICSNQLAPLIHGLDHEITIAPDIQQFEELSSFQTCQCFHILTNLPGMAGGRKKPRGSGEAALANLLGRRSYKVVADKVTLVFSTLCVCIYIYT